MLWIALHLPLLSLESFVATIAAAAPGGDGPARTARPVALLEAHRVVAANAAAQALGVKAGLKRATALALAPQITLGQADAARDAGALLPVAHAALAFTPSVCLLSAEVGAAAHIVLLEVQASLRYFGGIEALLERLRAAVRPLGHALRIATAATPQGAALLARIEPPPLCADLAETRRALDALPLWLLGPGREHWEAVQGMGLRTLADLLAMPRAGLARRFGEGLLAEIDAALGHRPDPREPIVLAPAFESRLELFARADTTEQVLHGAAVLLERLVSWLAAQHAFVRRFRLLMQHESRWREGDRTPACTALDIALAEPSRDSAHLLVILRERLAHVQLPAPTLELALYAEDISRRPLPNVELFPTPHQEHEGLTRLIERLQARLGDGQVTRLLLSDDHRPEKASSTRPADAASVGRRPRGSGRAKRSGTATDASRPAASSATALVTATATATAAMATAALTASERYCVAPRPVWLLPQPEPLAELRLRPVLDGRPLSLLSGPERIESGWWDEALAERDYFIAETDDGALVWIFRARLPLSRRAATTDGDGDVESGPAPGSGWFLHGRFG